MESKPGIYRFIVDAFTPGTVQMKTTRVPVEDIGQFI